MMYVHYEQAVEAMTKGMSQVFIGSRGVHAPGEGLDRTRAKNRENGIPVTEETWARILQAEKENVQKIAPKF